MTDEELPEEPSQTTQGEDSITKEIADLAFDRAGNFVELYANYVSFATSPWDMTIMFGRAVADDPRNAHIEQRAAISLSPQTAKAMAHALLRNLQSYERQFGEIRYVPLPQQPEEPST